MSVGWVARSGRGIGSKGMTNSGVSTLKTSISGGLPQTSLGRFGIDPGLRWTKTEQRRYVSDFSPRHWDFPRALSRHPLLESLKALHGPRQGTRSCTRYSCNCTTKQARANCCQIESYSCKPCKGDGGSCLASPRIWRQAFGPARKLVTGNHVTKADRSGASSLRSCQ